MILKQIPLCRDLFSFSTADIELTLIPKSLAASLMDPYSLPFEHLIAIDLL